MTIDASCPNCGTVFTVRRELIGKRTKCTRCGVPFVIAEPTPGPPRFESAASPSADVIFPESPTQFSAAPAAAPHRQVPPSGSGKHVFSSESVGIERDQSRPSFPAMRIVAKAYEVMAFIVLAIDVLLLIGFLIAVIRNPSSIIAAFFAWGISFLWTMATALMLLFISQAIRLWLQIEQNTRETSEAVRRLADHLCSIETER